MRKSFPRNVAFVLALLVFFSCNAEGYRLNVPRVLFPYHPSVPVSFILEVTHPSGGCFTWRSTRPEIVSVKLLNAETTTKCSERAEIRSVARPGGIGSSELSAVIFAEDQSSGTTLSCGVTVDEISTISIETTTKVLFVDAAPARMTVDAFNAEGDRFSTLSEIALEWELSENTPNGERPLKIVPFEQSTYEAPSEIVKLEKNRKKGYLILIEGVSTGSANLSAKFSDSYLQKVKAHNVELAVVANLLLMPSQTLYLPVQSVVPFQVLIVKQFGTEVVPMPSTAYHLQVDSNDIAKLDLHTSSIRALSKGNTIVHLLSSNVDVRAKAGIRPPSTAVFVTDPEAVQWHVSGENWMLETGKTFELNVEMLDEHSNVMYIGDNLRFDSLVSNDIFRIDFASKNGTWFHVTPMKPAKTVVKSKLVAVIDQDGREVSQSGRVHGEQLITVVDPVKIIPPVVYLPFLSKYKSTFDLKALGGSGLFEWSISDSRVASIETNSGRVIANALGNAVVTAVDKRNNLLKDDAEVHVLDIVGLTFGETPRETFIGSNLVLNVQLQGVLPNGQRVPFSDCRSIPLKVEVGDSALLSHVDDATSNIPTIGTGCGTVALKGLASGDTRITLSFDHFKAAIDVSVYEKLEIATDYTAIGVGSSYGINVSGGPRPWILDSGHFYRTVSKMKQISASFDSEKLVLECSGDETTGNVQLKVGNRKSSSLPLPVSAELTVDVCCTQPTRLEIVSEKEHPVKCPANVHAILMNSNDRVVLRGHGVCAGESRELMSINGLEAKWSSLDDKMIKVDKSGVEGEKVWARLLSKTKTGQTTLVADVASIRKVGRLSKHLTAKYDVTVAGEVAMVPPRLVLWNEPISTGSFEINGGSGYFLLDENSNTNLWPVTALIKGRSLQVAPKMNGHATLRVTDACFVEQSAEAKVVIADIHSLAVNGPQFVEIGQEVVLEIVAQDETGATFAHENRALADAQLEASNAHGTLRKIGGLRYALRAESVGTVSLTATAKSTTGRSLASRPRVVQIFSPIFLQPKRLTLIPESTFQLEVVGGPQPTPPLEFALNSTKVASIAANALITSKDLGWTSITGTVRVGDGHVTKDTVILRVVSLSGVALSSSGRRVEAGSRLNVRLRGIVAGARDEEPFAFGGALYPFKVTWSVSDPSVLQSAHPLGADVSEESENKFAIWYNAMRAGAVTVKVRVEIHANAKKHFASSQQVFHAETTITVEQPLMLVTPEMAVNTVRVAPNTQVQLETAWSQSSVTYSVPEEFSNRVSVTPSGLVKSAAREGSAVIAVRRKESPDNETSLVPLSIMRVYSLDVLPLNEIVTPNDKSPLMGLPVGVELKLQVVFRDARGRKLLAASNKVNYRPHRFDLTDISATNNNRTLSIVMKSPGETVLQISDASSSEVATFIRLSAAETLLPHAAVLNYQDLHVSDVICLKPALAGDKVKWSSEGSSEGGVHWLDAESGVGRLAKAGGAHITSTVGGQSLYSKLHIREPQMLRFTSQQQSYFVSNDDSVYAFSVTTATNYTGDKKTSSVYGECTPEQQTIMETSLDAPFDCFVSFEHGSKSLPAVNWLSANAVFDKNFGYECKIRRLDESLTTAPVKIPEEMQKQQFEALIVARWNLGHQSVKDAVLRLPFYFALRVEEKELALSNVNQIGAPLSIWAPKYHYSDVVVRGCEGNIVKVSSTSASDKHATHANLFYVVNLNVNSAAMFEELAKECHVTIENTKTSQVIRVPVKVRLVGEAAKHVYNALDSKGFVDIALIVLQKYSYLIPSMLWTCFVGILVILGWLYVKNNMLAKQGSFNDTTRHETSLLNHTSFQSSLPGSAESSINPTYFRDSPMFRSTPIAGSPAVGIMAGTRPTVGSGGDGRLWTTNVSRKRVGPN